MSLIRAIKQHISFMIPLLTLLFSIQSYMVTDRTVDKYTSSINSGYSIIMAVETELKVDEIAHISSQIKELSEIEPAYMLNKIKDEISSANYALLKLSLPKFYKLTLNTFPTDKELSTIKEGLDKIKKIKNVETFTKSHGEIYNLLSLSKNIVKVFAISIFVVSLMLIIKQIEVWRFVHSERMVIMEYFGAPYWMKSAALFQFAIIDSLLAVVLVCGFFFWLSVDGAALGIQELFFEHIEFFVPYDGVLLALWSVLVSLFSVLIVISSKKRNG